MIVEDGTGTGFAQKINSDNQAHTFSATESHMGYIARKNQGGFIIASGFISLTTTGSYNGIMYVKYTGDKILRLEAFRSCYTGSGYAQIIVRKNPTTGTLISDANSAYVSNSNYASATELSGLVYSASGDGKTVTDGAYFSQFTNKAPGHSIQSYAGSVILEKGNSIAVTIKPSVAGEFCVELQVYESDKEV